MNSFVKHKGVVICEHEDDRDNSEDVNMLGYAFEENGYKVISVQGSYFGVFLSYKIERYVAEGFKRDTDFSINSVAKNVLAIEGFEVVVDERKLKYLRENKTGRMKKSELIAFGREELETLLRRKINDNYIYNMTYNEEHKTTKFNIIIEKELSNGSRVKLMTALEYVPNNNTLRLITMV